MRLPLLTRPRFLGIKNHFVHGHSLTKRFARDAVIAALSLVIMYVIYTGTCELFSTSLLLRESLVISPVLLLSLFLTLLLGMVFLSTTIAAISCLYLSLDLDRLLASPLPARAFFIGKAFETFQSAGWMVIVFALPSLVAFMHSFGLSILESIFTLLLCSILIMLPTLWSMGCAILFARFLPLQYIRRLFLFIAIIAIACIYFLVQLIGGVSPGTERGDVLNTLLSHISTPAFNFLPSHWVALILGEIILPTGTPVLFYTGGLILLLLLTIAATYWLIKNWHHTTYSESLQKKYAITIDSMRGQKRLHALFFFLHPPTRALLGKEIKVFTRDMTQALQLMMLIGLCAIYLYNFGTVREVAESASSALILWQPILLTINIIMGCFVVTAICSRFVFPSISIEGQSMWILLSSPVSISEFLSTKFWCWYYPVAAIAVVILGSGALAIQAPPSLILATIITALISTFGIVGLAIGLGAVFAQFDWEHVSQLSANLGSVLFMIASMILVFIGMGSVCIFLLLYFAQTAGYLEVTTNYQLSIASTALLLFYINILAQRWALLCGVVALEKKYL